MSGSDPIRSPGPLRERLYALLPAVYRSRDVAQGEPLRALMAVLEAELEAIRADVDTTYDNWFVETCEEWVLPYLAASLGVHAMRPVDGDVVSLRAYVANTLAYRRRKGTAAVLEQLAQDLTGFRARVVEYFRRTATTVHVQRVRGQLPAMGGTVDLRDAERLQRIATGHGAFDPHAHTGDVRLVSTGRGRYNLPNLGLHVWRVLGFEVNRATARPIEGEPGWYRIDPHGFDGPVYNVPQTEQSITSLAEEIHVPHSLTRLALHADLQVPQSERRYLGIDPALEVRVISGGTESGPWPLQICNLADGPGGLPSRRPAAGVVAVDPELGRLVFSPDDLPPVDAGPMEMEVQVDHAYGSPARVGAGTFDRSEAWSTQLGNHAINWTRYVTRHPTLASELSADTELEAAVAAWNAHVADAAGPAVGCIVILGGRTRPDMPAIAPESRSYAAPSSTISLPGGSRLYIVSAGVDRQPGSDGSGLQTTIVPNRVRTPIYGDLVVAGTAGGEDGSHRGGLLLNGLSIEGRIRVEPGELGILDLAHCTVATPPGSSAPGGIDIGSAPGQTNATLQLRLFAGVCGPIVAAGDATSLDLQDSVVHGEASDDGAAVNLPATALRVEGSTILGGTSGRTLEASNSLLDGPLAIEQHQQGCLRFCYAPPGAKGPRRHRCQPDLALEGIVDAGQRAIVISRVQPGYVSTDYRHPAHVLLRPGTPIEIRTGAEDGGELGVHHHLQYARRLANLHQALRQYLRFGLEVGVFAES